jgi:hypothetical protein
LVTDWDFHNKRIRTIVNGVVKQDSTTAEMEWDMHYLVADIARTITLVPGDILFSGTPAFSRTVYPGDVVTVVMCALCNLEGSPHDFRFRGPDPYYFVCDNELACQMRQTLMVLDPNQPGHSDAPDWDLARDIARGK